MEDVKDGHRNGLDEDRPEDLDFGAPLTRMDGEDDGNGRVSPTKRSFEQFHEFELNGGNTPRRRLSSLARRRSSIRLSLRRSKAKNSLF